MTFESLKMITIPYRKALFKCAIVFLIINGLSPFSYNQKASIVTMSRKQYAYSSIVSALLIFSSIFGILHIDYNYYSEKHFDIIVLLVVFFELIFCIVKAITYFLLHNLKPTAITALVNEALKVNEIVNTFAKTTTQIRGVENVLKRKIVGMSLQILCLLLMISDLDYFRWFLLVYPLVISMIANTVYIFGGMLIILKSVYIINEKLHRLKTSEDIEEVSIILDKIQNFLANLNSFYGWLVTLSLVGSTFIILSSVEFIN